MVYKLLYTLLTTYAMTTLTDLKATDLRYDAQGIYIRDQFIPCDNPRLQFAKQLAAIPDNGMMYGREGSWFHSRVMCDWRQIKWGLNCVIGSIGFGFERDNDGSLVSIPHHGFVVLENGVELGNCTCIDRGVIGATIIGEGSKLDNLIHVGHGAKIGKHCLIVAGVVVGGSCEIGDYTFIGMNVSIKNKIKIGKNCIIGAGAVVLKDVEDNSVMVGNPAKFLRTNETAYY